MSFLDGLRNSFYGRKSEKLDSNKKLNEEIIAFLENIASHQGKEEESKKSIKKSKSSLKESEEFQFFQELFNFFKIVQINLLMPFQEKNINSLGGKVKYLLFFKKEWEDFLEKQQFKKGETKEFIQKQPISNNQFLIFLLLMNYFLNKFRKSEKDKITVEFLEQIFKKYQRDTGDTEYQNLFILEKDSISNLFLSVLFDFITKDLGNEIKNLKIIKRLFPNININNNLTHQGQTTISRIFEKLLEQKLKNKKLNYIEFLQSLLEEKGEKKLDLIKYQDSQDLVNIEREDEKYIVTRKKKVYNSLRNAFECQKQLGKPTRVETTILSVLIRLVSKVRDTSEIQAIKRRDLNLLLIACEDLNRQYNQTKATEKEKAYFEFMMNSVVYLGDCQNDIGKEAYLSVFECLQKISENLSNSSIREKEILNKTLDLMRSYKIKTIKQLKEGLNFEGTAHQFTELEDFSIFEQFKDISQDTEQDTKYFLKKHFLNQIDQISKPPEEAGVSEKSEKVISYLDSNELNKLKINNTKINDNLLVRDIGKTINNQLYQAFSDNKISQENFLEPKTYMGLGLQTEVYEDGDNFVFEIIANPTANSLIGKYNTDLKENQKIKKGCVVKIARSKNINNINEALLYVRNNGLNKDTIIESLSKERIKAKITPALQSFTKDKRIEFFDFNSIRKELAPVRSPLTV